MYRRLTHAIFTELAYKRNKPFCHLSILLEIAVVLVMKVFIEHGYVVKRKEAEKESRD